jgi:hypothetical protein
MRPNPNPYYADHTVQIADRKGSGPRRDHEMDTATGRSICAEFHKIRSTREFTADRGPAIVNCIPCRRVRERGL